MRSTLRLAGDLPALRRIKRLRAASDMSPLLILLAVAVFAYLYRQRHSTTLTRDCRWRQAKSRGCWRCAFCGSKSAGETEPKDCLRR